MSEETKTRKPVTRKPVTGLTFWVAEMVICHDDPEAAPVPEVTGQLNSDSIKAARAELKCLAADVCLTDEQPERHWRILEDRGGCVVRLPESPAVVVEDE